MIAPHVTLKTDSFTLDADIPQEVARQVFKIIADSILKSPVRVEWTLGPVTLRVDKPKQ